MGKFLKENPQYDFDELAISKLNYSKIVDGKAIRNDWLYIVATQDKKLHIVFEDFDDGSSFASRAVAANDFILSYRQESMRLKFGDINDNIKVTKKGKIKITNIGYFFDAINFI